MEPKSCAIIGASGLIGKEILKQVVLHPLYSEIRIITRRPLGTTDPKIKEIIIDFENLSQLKSSLEGVTDVFCVVGTTQKKVNGDKYLYRKVDYNIPVDAAQISVENGVQYFAVVSSVGASLKSSNFYLKLKGEMEHEVSRFSIPQIGIFRPSMLLGKRDEFRFAEKISSYIFPVISFLFPIKYRPIQAKHVAKAMIQYANQSKGVHILHYKEMAQLFK